MKVEIKFHQSYS